jgi:hypothetical protein
MKITIDKAVLILIAIFIIYACLHAYFYSVKEGFYTIDAPNHALFCFQFYRDLDTTFKNLDLDFLSKVKKCFIYFREGIIYWPKFLYLTSLPFIYILGLSLISIKCANLLYLFILMLYSYLLSYELTKDKINSLYLAAVLPLFPIIFEAIQGYGLDFPLTALIVMFFYYLIKTDSFSKLNYSIYAGLVLGTTFLIKGQVIVFVLLPIFWEALRGIVNNLNRKDPQKLFWILANISVFVILSYGIASIWWNGKFLDIWHSLREHTISHIKYLESHPLEEYKSLSYYGFYLKYLFKDGIGPLLFVIILLSNIFFFLKKDFRNKFIYFLWILIPLIVFSFLFQVKQLRFIMPAVPAIVISSGSIFHNKRKWIYIYRSLLIGILSIQLIHPDFITKTHLGFLFSRKVNVQQWKSVHVGYKIGTTCIKSFEDKLSPGNYKVIIFKFASISDGPLALQFWLELLGYKKGYNLYTHDFIDQLYSVYSWLKERKKEDKFIFIFLDENKNINLENFFTRDIILTKMRRLINWCEEYENNNLFKELVEEVLPNIKDKLRYVSEFRYLNYNGKVYKL